MNEETLRSKLNQSEDPWVERKESCHPDKVLKTLVGFANAVPFGAEPAILFIGASNSGEHPGIPDADTVQKEVTGLASRAHPEIALQTKVFTTLVGGQSKEILAVIIPPSSRRPHFSGSAWIRRGSETVRANSEMLEDLIASRHDTARVLQGHRGDPVALSMISKPTGLRIDYWGARLRSVSAKTVEVDTNEGGYYPFAIDTVRIIHEMPTLIQLEAPCPWTEAEHIQKMIQRWAAADEDPQGVMQTRTRYLAEQLWANLPITLGTIRWAAKKNPGRAQRSLLSNAEMIAREMKIT